MYKILCLSLTASVLGLSLLCSGCCGGAALVVADSLLDDEKSKQILKGAVSLGGVPVEGAVITLTPEKFDGETTKISSATTDSTGSYSMAFRWARYRHYHVDAVYKKTFDTDDEADDLTYIGSADFGPVKFETQSADFQLSLQAAPPSSSFFVSGTVRLEKKTGQMEGDFADGALITIQAAFSPGENIALFAGRAGPDGSYRISVPWYSGRPYLVNVVYPANAEPAQNEQLETATEWIGPFDTLPLQDEEHNFQLVAVTP